MHREFELSTCVQHLYRAMIDVRTSGAITGIPLVIYAGRALEALLHPAVNVSGSYLND